MKHTFINRIGATTLVVLALSIFGASQSFGALNAYLQLKGTKNGKSYKTTTDATGKFSFKDVVPGSYELRFVGSPEYFAAAEKGHKDAIEVISFQYGMALSQSGAGGSHASQAGSLDSRVADADVTGDRKSAKTIMLAKTTKDGKTYYKIIYTDIVISAVCSPRGALQGDPIHGVDIKLGIQEKN